MQGMQVWSLARELKSHRQEELVTGEGEEVGDGRVEWSSAIGDYGRQAAMSLTPNIDGTHVHMFESSYVGDFD